MPAFLNKEADKLNMDRNVQGIIELTSIAQLITQMPTLNNITRPAQG